jgi:hypothetical protein
MGISHTNIVSYRHNLALPYSQYYPWLIASRTLVATLDSILLVLKLLTLPHCCLRIPLLNYPAE